MPKDLEIEYRDPESLLNHPLNAEIYGSDPDPDFIESVGKYGVLVPIVVVPSSNNQETVISGHKRKQAARMKSLPLVPVIVMRGIGADEVPELLVTFNKQRVKSDKQKLAEASILKPLERKGAADRMASGLPCAPGAQGRVQDRIAAKTGMTNSEARNAISVSDAIESAEESGDTETVEDLSQTVDTDGLSAAARKVKDAKKPKGPEIPKHLQRIWEGMPLWKEAHAAYGKLRGTLLEISRLHSSEGVRAVPIGPINDSLGETFVLMTKAEPTKLCPKCKGVKGGCAVCKERGYLVKG